MRWPIGSSKGDFSNPPIPQPSQMPMPAPEVPNHNQIAYNAPPPPRNVVGRNYQPFYLPHPAAVPDPYAAYLAPPKPEPTGWIIPRLSIRLDDLSNPGATLFLKHINPYEAMKDVIVKVLETLYTVETQPRNVRSVTLIIRDFPGVAHACGSAANDKDKEIHLSTRHIQASQSRAQSEIMGVLQHEMVHCFQYNAKGTCPGGLIEGIADFVRLRADLSPPHWKRELPSQWDAGYQHTAYFLDWVEQIHGQGVIRALNEGMRKHKYKDGQVWYEVTGRSVGDLFAAYAGSF